MAELTEQGFDALKQRRTNSTEGNELDKKGRAFAEAVERLKADYQRLLKRDE